MLPINKIKLNLGNSFAVNIKYNFNSVQDGIQMHFVVHNIQVIKGEFIYFL